LDDKLATFAEIGVAIAGFSGIVAALGRDSYEAWSPSRQRLMTLLLETAGLCVFFSITPLVLGELTVSEPVLWRISAALFAAAHAYHMVLIERRGTSADAAVSSVRSKVPFVAIPVLSAQVISVFVGNLVLLKFAYLLALAWHVAGGALSFGLLLLVHLRQDAA
jgi:hypothetical protein